MKRFRGFPFLTVAAACALAAAPVASASAATDTEQTSSGNWSGYVVGDAADGQTFKTVTGSWVQPTAKCTAGEATYAAFWVGLGGADSKQALEQDGSEVNCSADGTATYYAWYELVPKAPVKVDLAVSPGDHLTATTTVDGHDVTETIVNHTTGHTFSKTLTMSDPDTSTAEWIAEAPSSCQGSVSNCTALSLGDFGKVSFSSATATDSSGHTGTIADSQWKRAAVTLDPSASQSSMGGGQFVSATSSGSGSASPSALGADGETFAVTYRRSGGEASASSSGYGYDTGGGSAYGDGGAGSYGYGGGEGYGSGYGGYGGYGGGSYGYGSGYSYIVPADGGYVIVSGY